MITVGNAVCEQGVHDYNRCHTRGAENPFYYIKCPQKTRQAKVHSVRHTVRGLLSFWAKEDLVINYA